MITEKVAAPLCVMGPGVVLLAVPCHQRKAYAQAADVSGILSGQEWGAVALVLWRERQVRG